MTHQHHAHEPASENGRSGIKLAFFLNTGFTLIEIAGGFLTNSVAIISDALHDLGDSLSLGIAWYFERLARRGRSEKYSYGYKRFSVLAAIINSVILITGSIFIFIEALQRFSEAESVQVEGMFILACIGILVNGAAVLRLKRKASLNADVVRLHLLEDVFGWFAILIGAIVMYFWQVPWIDPALSIGIAAFVLFQVFKRLRYSIRIIMQAIPESIDMSTVLDAVSGINEVESLHDPHLWSLDGDYNVFTVHAVVKDCVSKDDIGDIKQKIRETLRSTNIQHSTIEIEFSDEECVLIDC